MIRISCTQCHAVLEIDDAFAGGVCRCQHCGTIQTVPRQAPRHTPANSASPRPIPQTDSTRALYQNSRETTPSGLEDLASAVASSGLGSGLHERSTPGRPGAARAKAAGRSAAKGSPRSPLPWIIGGAALLALGVIAVVFWARPSVPVRLGSGDGRTTNGSTDIAGSNDTNDTNDTNDQNNQANAGGPRSPRDAKRPPENRPGQASFAGVPLRGRNIALLLDRGDATRDYFGNLKAAAAKSVATLNASQRFQVIFWDDGQVDAYPEAGNAPASAAEAKKVDAWLGDFFAGRQTSIDASIELAMKAPVDEMVIITGKALDLPDDFAQTVLDLRGSRNIVIHTIALGDAAPDGPLQQIATRTGGTFRKLSEMDLNDLAW